MRFEKIRPLRTFSPEEIAHLRKGMQLTKLGNARPTRKTIAAAAAKKPQRWMR